jgi:hypothetical protein
LQAAFANDGNITVLDSLNGCAKACNSSSDDQTVGEELVRRCRIDIYQIASGFQLSGHKVFTLSVLF